MEYTIEVKNLTYTYNNKHKALDDLSFSVPKGSIYGFLGPNGAGKSTTMRMISGIMPDEQNNIKVFDDFINKQIPQIYHRIGCLVEQPVLYSHLTAIDHLQYIVTSNKTKDVNIDEMLSIIGLEHAKNLKTKQFSLGMKQRLAIGMCLIKKPELLLLDEPVNGLDPSGISEVRAMLLRLNQELGMTIFISSHLLVEIEKMCSHICILNKGKKNFEGTLQALQKRFDRMPIKIKTNPIQFPIKLAGYDIVQGTQDITIAIKSKDEIPNIIRQLNALGIDIYEVKQEGNLESWFMDMVQ